MTLWLLILAVALGFLLAIPLAVARTCGNPLLRYPVWLYTYVFRGTPLYIQLLFFYTGVYSLNAIRAQDFQRVLPRRLQLHGAGLRPSTPAPT